MTALPTVGDSARLVVCEEVTRTRIAQYAGASGDYSAMHTDEPAARAAGHPSIMAHGMMTMAASARVVTDWFGADAMRTYDARFTAPVWPGDRLSCTAVVTAVDSIGSLTHVRLRIETADDTGRLVLTGTARVAIDLNSNFE